MTPLLIALAGGLGASTRLVVDGLVMSKVRGHWPLGTMLINLTGSFALGVVAAGGFATTVTLVAGTGFLGGYTTASTISFEVAQRARGGRPVLAVAIAATTLITCLAAAAAGRLAVDTWR